MTNDLRSLLNDVAAGRVDPGKAAELLDTLDANEDGAPRDLDPPGVATPSEPPAASGSTLATPDAVERVYVSATARPVRIVGDHTVDTITVDGPHSVVRDGGVLRVQAGANVPTDGSGAAGSYSYERKTGFSRWIAQAGNVGVPVTVRMNPSLVLDAEVMAGSLEVVGLHGPVAFTLTAGSLRLHDCTGVVNGVVRAGSAVLQVRPTQGQSAVRVESGSVDLRLLPGSDVRLSGHADLGEFKVRGADGSLKLQKTDTLAELVLGSGAATFDLQLAMGSAKVRLP
jgi:hypothetical protein